jgi:hypothetical protein
MEIFNSGWMSWLGVLCVLYILFGSSQWTKVTAFIILLFIAGLELVVVMNWLP